MKRLLIPVLLFIMLGCHAATAPIPGSANAFDSASYLTLATTDSVIQSTKIDLASGAFSTAIAPAIKTALNALILAYNAADQAYRVYHAAALAGTSTPAQQATVTTDLNQVQVATAALTNAKAGM